MKANQVHEIVAGLDHPFTRADVIAASGSDNPAQERGSVATELARMVRRGHLTVNDEGVHRFVTDPPSRAERVHEVVSDMERQEPLQTSVLVSDVASVSGYSSPDVIEALAARGEYEVMKDYYGKSSVDLPRNRRLLAEREADQNRAWQQAEADSRLAERVREANDRIVEARKDEIIASVTALLYPNGLMLSDAAEAARISEIVTPVARRVASAEHPAPVTREEVREAASRLGLDD